MKQVGPRSTTWLVRWILMGIVMIGAPSEIPANRSKLDGTPADSTVATALTPPTLTSAGSATSAPPGGETPVTSPVAKASPGPACRLVLAVIVVVAPMVKLPCVEFEPRQMLCEFSPSVASIAGSSTGQRKNGAQT